MMMRGASRHLDVSSVPFGSKSAHDPRVEWSVTTVNRGVGGNLNAPKSDENPRLMQGNKNEVMESTNINP
ncbi:MAG: hypothetical protein QXH78_02775 [Desulfurococcaceae archaeon]